MSPTAKEFWDLRSTHIKDENTSKNIFQLSRPILLLGPKYSRNSIIFPALRAEMY